MGVESGWFALKNDTELPGYIGRSFMGPDQMNEPNPRLVSTLTACMRPFPFEERGLRGTVSKRVSTTKIHNKENALSTLYRYTTVAIVAQRTIFIEKKLF